MTTTQQSDPFGPPQAKGPSGPRAGFWIRWAASLLDGVILAVPYVVLIVVIRSGAAFALFLVISAAYYSLQEGGPSGQTLGKKALGIRVIDFATGGPIGYGRGFIRWIGRTVSAVVFFLGYLWMLWDREKQAWHDKMANDVVVPVSAYPLG
jgi:uncharacterized RDD family membrane protein YckC